jgi:RNA polymerase sigma-70 factor, ECF subfamily
VAGQITDPLREVRVIHQQRWRIILSEPSRKGLESLLQRARDGDRDAMNELFESCRAYVGFLARSHVESWIQAKVDSSDLIQQTLMEAHQGFPNFSGQTEGEWIAWLKQILKHNATDFVRRFGAAKRRVTLEVAISNGNDSTYFRAAPELSSGGESPSQVMVRREQEIEISEALATLPDAYQEVIVLRNLQRLPFDEIAERMERSRPATQMLWMRALKKLQAQLHVENE